MVFETDWNKIEHFISIDQHTVSVHILQRICHNWVQQCYVDIDIAKDQDLQPMEDKQKRGHYIHIYHQRWFLWWNSNTERQTLSFWCNLIYLMVNSNEYIVYTSCWGFFQIEEIDFVPF